jgi:hypothetical protein
VHSAMQSLRLERELKLHRLQKREGRCHCNHLLKTFSVYPENAQKYLLYLGVLDARQLLDKIIRIRIGAGVT